MSEPHAMPLDAAIQDAIANEDIAALKRLQDLVAANADVTQDPGEMAPHIVVKPTPEAAQSLGIAAEVMVESAGALNVANRIANAIRRLEFQRDKRERPQLPTLVAEGDSWFLHELIDDTLDHLRVARFNVRSLAAAGDTVDNMLATTRYIDVLREEGARVFLFSGGGNDLLGDGRIKSVVRPEDSNLRPDQLVNEPTFQRLLGDVIRLYTGMLATVAARAPGVQVFAHGYDRVVRIDAGPWIWPFLREMGYSKERGIAVVGVLLDRFNEALADVTRRHTNFTYVDMRGLVGDSPASWFDAIHPRSTGFAKVAERLGDRVRAFLDTEAVERGGQQEGVFGLGVEADAGIARAVIADTGMGANRAITRAFRRRDLNDFERVRAALAVLPPESEWLRFSDPLVHAHIRDVIALLEDPGQGQSPEIVENRLRTRPQTMDRGSELAPASATRMSDGGPDLMPVGIIDYSLTEALFGNAEIEPLQVLLKGYQAGQAVGRVQIMNQYGSHVAHGSGFLVAPGLFLTNHHVLPTADAARRSFVIFRDETPLDGSLPAPVRFRITDEVFWASEASDYAFASVEPVNRDGVALAPLGHLQLIQESGKALAFEPVSIIQHPGGDPKAIAIRNSFVMGRIGDGIYYTTDTLGGSSGAPVLNREWQVVALHHRYVPHPTEAGGVIANRGIRISAIYDDLYREQGLGNRMAIRVLQALNAERVASFERVDGAAPVEVAPVEAAETIAGGVYDGLTPEEFAAAIAREEIPGEDDIPLPAALTGGIPGAGFTEALSTAPDAVLARVGDRGYRLIVGFEVSSRSNYERRLKSPILPGGASGVTIGIGYDLGHVGRDEFRGHWSDLLPEADLTRLEACIGRTRAAAAAVLPRVRDIEVSYEDAIKVFERASLPKVFAQLNRHVRDAALDALPPPCIGALVSLTYNRGPSYQATGDRYREMRAIRAALNGGAPERVPGLIREMKRLWVNRPDVAGLLRRRDEEAELFAEGLAARGEETVESAPAPVAAPEAGYEVAYEAGAGEAYDPTPDLDETSEVLQSVSFTEAATPRISAADVGWVGTFSNNPDYAHLPAGAEGAAFRLDAALIETALRLGHYQPHITDGGNLIVAIRGARLAGGAESAPGQEAIALEEQKPDHRTFRCVMAVYHRPSGRISAFRASTVPNRGGVASCANLLNGHGGTLANMLPTGCYELCVGTHFGSVTVPTVLRLGNGPVPANAGTVTTLRTRNDGIYGTQDLWDTCKPADNVHPAFSASSAEFSSLGCLTVPGRFANGQHSGLWARFRETAGFDGNRHLGTRYDLLLTTGMELAAIARAPEAERAGLRRLAHGSAGPEVAALRQALGLAAGTSFDPATKKRLTEREAEATGGAATGIYSAVTERRLGLGVFR